MSSPPHNFGDKDDNLLEDLSEEATLGLER